MKQGFLVLLSLVLLFSVTTLARADDRIVRLDGFITQVTDSGIVLHTRRGDVAIHVTQDTRIMRNGHRARLGDLRRGDRAHVIARRVFRRDALVALAIRARGDRR